MEEDSDPPPSNAKAADESLTAGFHTLTGNTEHTDLLKVQNA